MIARTKYKTAKEAEQNELETKLGEIAAKYATPEEVAADPEYCRTLDAIRIIQNELDLIERFAPKSDANATNGETRVAAIDRVEIEVGDDSFTFSGTPEDVLLVREIVDAVREREKKEAATIAGAVCEAATNATLKKFVEFCLTFRRAPKEIDPLGLSVKIPSILAKYALAIFADSEKGAREAFDALESELTEYSAELRAFEEKDATNGAGDSRPTAVAEAATDETEPNE